MSRDHQPIQPTEDIPETTSDKTDDHGEIQECNSLEISANMEAPSETSEDNTEIQERLFLDTTSFEGEAVVPGQEKDDKENPFDGSDHSDADINLGQDNVESTTTHSLEVRLLCTQIHLLIYFIIN